MGHSAARTCTCAGLRCALCVRQGRPLCAVCCVGSVLGHGRCVHSALRTRHLSALRLRAANCRNRGRPHPPTCGPQKSQKEIKVQNTTPRRVYCSDSGSVMHADCMRRLRAKKQNVNVRLKSGYRNRGEIAKCCELAIRPHDKDKDCYLNQKIPPRGYCLVSPPLSRGSRAIQQPYGRKMRKDGNPNCGTGLISPG